MVPINSLDEVNIVAALLRDVYTNHVGVLNTRALNLTIAYVKKRVSLEGLGFLTKTLPRLAKAFDKVLACEAQMNAVELGFKPLNSNSKLPRFLGELFTCVLHHDGTALTSPCVTSIRNIRQVLYLFYKYELPYAVSTEQKVLSSFKKTEEDLIESDKVLVSLQASLTQHTSIPMSALSRLHSLRIVRVARNRLRCLFKHFRPQDIIPRHGPGSVATRQRLWNKYRWDNVSARITNLYPYDAYFCASMGAVCDNYHRFDSVDNQDLPARVVLVPKDSRGPRVISCEPVDNQWIQQGLATEIVRLVERHVLTKDNVRFTDQTPNQFGALEGSVAGRYSTLDLNEASDRISVELVKLLFPTDIIEYLMACRSLETELPDGTKLTLRKFAPMGSALCFPILALTVWSLLTAISTDSDTRKSIYVYGDDIIVPTALAADAIAVLEFFGLKVNRNKSCTKGFFRESCGVDAFKGVRVTPIKLRSVWSQSPSPNVYSSWVAYANSFWDRGCYTTYDKIVELLTSVYWPIADDRMIQSPIRLREAPKQKKSVKSRYNKDLQKTEFLSLEVTNKVITKQIDGWSMLLRWFTEGQAARPFNSDNLQRIGTFADICERSPFSVSTPLAIIASV